jgi:hypothetical protein
VGRAAAKSYTDELVDELVDVVDELLPDALLDDDPVLVVLLLPEFDLVTDELVVDVLVEVPDTLDDVPLPVIETEPVLEEEGGTDLDTELVIEEEGEVPVDVLPVTSKPQFLSTKEWVYDE